MVLLKCFLILDESRPTQQTVALPPTTPTLPTPPPSDNNDFECPTVLLSYSSVSGTVLSLMSVTFALAVRHGFVIPALLNLRTTVKYTWTDRHRVMLLVVTELTKTNSPVIVYLLGLLPTCPPPPQPPVSVPIPQGVESSTTLSTTTPTPIHTTDVAPLSCVSFPSSIVSVSSSSSVSESPSPVKPTVLVNPTFCHPLSDTSSLI